MRDLICVICTLICYVRPIRNAGGQWKQRTAQIRKITYTHHLPKCKGPLRFHRTSIQRTRSMSRSSGCGHTRLLPRWSIRCRRKLRILQRSKCFPRRRSTGHPRYRRRNRRLTLEAGDLQDGSSTTKCPFKTEGWVQA